MDTPNRSTAPLVPLLLERLWPNAGASPADLWVQGVSLGEVEIAATFVTAVLERRPHLATLVTASTPAGVALLSRRFKSLPVRLRPFPLDLPFSVRRFFSAVRPRLLVLVETEIWPMVVRAAARTGVPILLVSGRLGERSLRRFQALGGLSRPLFSRLHVSARSAEDARRFLALGVPEGRVTVGGNLKLDRPLPEEPAFAGTFRSLANGRPVLVAGSLAESEVAPVLEARALLKARGLDVFLLLAPRRPDTFGPIAAELENKGLRAVRRSRLDGSSPEAAASSAGPSADVFLLDTLGELGASYRLGDVAFLGGTLAPRGGHNVLEPLRAGLPTLHGPSTFGIREALRAAEGAVFQVDGAASLAARAEALLRDPAALERARDAAAALFASHSGAVGRAADLALALLDGAR